MLHGEYVNTIPVPCVTKTLKRTSKFAAGVGNYANPIIGEAANRKKFDQHRRTHAIMPAWNEHAQARKSWSQPHSYIKTSLSGGLA